MKKRITLETLLARSRKSDYKEQYSYITGLLGAGRIRPLKASGKDGKKPAL